MHFHPTTSSRHRPDLLLYHPYGLIPTHFYVMGLTRTINYTSFTHAHKMDALQQCWRDGTLLEDQWKQNRNPRVPNPLSVALFSHRKQWFHQGGLLTILCSAIEKICVVAYVIFKCNQCVSLKFESYGHN